MPFYSRAHAIAQMPAETCARHNNHNNIRQVKWQRCLDRTVCADYIRTIHFLVCAVCFREPSIFIDFEWTFEGYDNCIYFPENRNRTKILGCRNSSTLNNL